MRNNCGSMTWWYVTPNGRYSSHMLIFFEHSPQRGFRKDIYLLILFSTLLTGYVSSLLFQTVLLSTKWQAYFILIYDYLDIMSHVNLRSKFCPGLIKFLASPLVSSLNFCRESIHQKQGWKLFWIRRFWFALVLVTCYSNT